MAQATEAPEEEPATLPEGGSNPFEGEEGDSAPDVEKGAVTIFATLVDVAGHTGSTQAGATGTLKFQCEPSDAQDLFGYMGEQAFDVTFDKAGLGKGLTIRSVTGRPDADGSPVSAFILNVPTTEIIGLAACFTRGLIGKHSKLVMDASQLSFDLTKRAE